MSRKVRKFNYLDQVKPENSIIDEYTGHALVDTPQGIVELKYCRHCKKWHTLDSFYRSSTPTYRDGLGVYCKDCSKAKAVEYARVKRGLCSKPVIVKEPVRNEEPVSNAAPSLDGIISAYIESVVKPYRDRINELESEVSAARSEAERKVDMSKISAADFEKAVYARTDIAPRVYFNALKRMNGGWTFKVYDANTGLTTEVKTEVA